MSQNGQYPIKEVKLDIWNKKVNATSMFTIPAEDEALPVLKELDQILTRLLTSPIEQTIAEQHVEYFFVNVFPVVCYKIIRSRYFKSNVVLKYANSILQNSVYLVNKYFEIGIKFPKFLEILSIVLCTDEYYFKSNDQLSYYHFPYSYFPHKSDFGQSLKVGDYVDILKIDSIFDKLTWSQGQVIEEYGHELLIAYLYDCDQKHTKIRKDSPQIAPFQSKSKQNMEWRLNIKKGDVIDCQQMYGNWYNATVTDVIEQQEKKKKVKVVFKVKHPQGNRVNEQGEAYFGSQSDDYLQIDVTSPKISQFCSVANKYCFDAKSNYDMVQDSNDYEYSQVNGNKIYALPRKKYLSSLLFHTINVFGQSGGFQKILCFLEKQKNYDVFCKFSQCLNGISVLLHRKFINQILERFKSLVKNYIFEDSIKIAKQFSKQKSQMIFSGLKALQKRVLSKNLANKFENTIRMQIVQCCLEDKLTQKLQGLNQLKDIVKNNSYVAQKSKNIKNWIIQKNIFEQIYIINSHAQLIKKSEDFFKFLISQSILQVTDLQRLYKIAQKSDFETRMTLYKLFQDVAYAFKKKHVQFLIDTILQSDLSLIRNEDIDLLHQLSRFSNYFPLDKVINFFENIILSDTSTTTRQVNDYAIKKYSDIVVRNFDMKSRRRTIIQNFICKMGTHEISQITKVLKSIFEGIGVGQWGKKDLYDILADQKIDEACIDALRKQKDRNSQNFDYMLKQMLGFLLGIYKLSYKVKINVSTLSEIWLVVEGTPQHQRTFYKWVNQLFDKCQQGLFITSINEFQYLYRKLFSSQRIQKMLGLDFQVAKNLFIEANKKMKILSVTNCLRNNTTQKQYKRKVQMRELKLMDLIIEMIFQIKDQNIAEKMLSLFVELYNSKDNSQRQIDSFLDELLKDLGDYYENKQYRLINKIFKLIQVVINDSQKNQDLGLDSLRRMKSKKQRIKFMIINQIYYSSDTVKKIDMFLETTMTVMELRKKLAKQFDATWQEIRITSVREIPDYQNSKTLQEIKLNPNTPLTITKRIIYQSNASEQLIIGEQINPKAVRCFKIIFQRYSTDGLMDKDQCNSFTSMCLGSSSSRRHYNEKISGLYAQYDDDNDGFLTFQNFLTFYKDAALDRPYTVMSNLKSFGVRNNFRFRDEPEQDDTQITKFPRKILSQKQDFQKMLFDLLKVKQCAPLAYDLLERLPISQQIMDQILEINNEEAIQKILSSSDYELFYKLNIIEYLISSEKLTKDIQKQFAEKFISFHGFEKIYDLLNKTQICPQQTIKNQQLITDMEAVNLFDINQHILQTILVMLKDYFYAKICHNKKIQSALSDSLSLISSEYDISEKIQYLVTGQFPNKQQKLVKIQNRLLKLDEKLFDWQGLQFQQIGNSMLKKLTKLWNMLKICSNQQQKTKHPAKKQKITNVIYQLEILISKALHIIHILYLDQKSTAQLLICTLLDLLTVSSSHKLLIEVYCIIFCQCFFAENDNSIQSIQSNYIKQLFKTLTKNTMITTQHFLVLAVLVSKYGVNGGDEKHEQIDKMKQILFSNILSNDNQLIIQGCAQLLYNFNLQKINFEIFEKIWQNRLFNKSSTVTRQKTKQMLYNLIIKICRDNKQMIDKIIQKVRSTIQQYSSQIRITYCNQYKQRSLTKYAGLKNLGNICYMNSMLQQIYTNKTFRNLLLRINDFKDHTQSQIFDQKQQSLRLVDDNLLHQTQKIFTYLDLTTRIDYAPKDFCIAYKPFGESVNIMIQQDVQQFISMFFDRLQNFINETPFRNIVQQFYSGKTANLFKCHSCKKSKKVQENFHCLTLQIKNAKTLEQSFNRFITGQQINDYKCDFCEMKVDVQKKTVVSSPPRVLLIHLQRIIFNLDTFINQKLSTKHEFPNTFNIYPYTLDYIQNQAKKNSQPKKQSEEESSKQNSQILLIAEGQQAKIEKQSKKNTANQAYQYQLTGIVCHSGHAQAGHYISYIRTVQNKWIQFNDSLVTYFNPADIQSECFGGSSYSTTSIYDEDYEWDNKQETCKCAYMVIYERKNVKKQDSIFELIFDQKTKNIDRAQFFKQYSIQQVIQNLRDIQQKENNSAGKQLNNRLQQQMIEKQSQQKAAQDSQDQQTAQLLNAKQIQIKRHQSQDAIEVDIEQKSQKLVNKQLKTEKVKINIANVQSYHDQTLLEEIQHDNQIHFFEKCMSSSNFSKFFAELLSQPHNLQDQMLPICQKLAFGFWLKSPSFKELLQMLQTMIKGHYKGFQQVITQNKTVISLLIQNSETDVRSNMALFLSKSICNVIQSKPDIDILSTKQPIVQFLDTLLSLLPTTVTKSWTKFSQYFEFWYELATNNQKVVQYMLDRQIIKHFMDYFLDNKSPLRIYCDKKENQIGSSYASPNFSFLLKCVSVLLGYKIGRNTEVQANMSELASKLSEDEEVLLISCDSLQKLIADSYQFIAAKLVKQICPGNLYASERAAFVILKGISKSNYETIQPYLEVIHDFLLIEDEYQDIRMKWVLGKETLAVSTYGKKLLATNSYTLDQRLYNFESSLNTQFGSSLLDHLFTYHKRMQNFSMLCLKEILILCQISTKIRKYIFNLGAPTLFLRKYSDFFKQFIQKACSYYGYYSSAFNKQELGKQLKKLYQKVEVKLKQDNMLSPEETSEQMEQQKQEQMQKHVISSDDVEFKDINDNLLEDPKEQIKNLIDREPEPEEQVIIQQNEGIQMIDMTGRDKLGKINKKQSSGIEGDNEGGSQQQLPDLENAKSKQSDKPKRGNRIRQKNQYQIQQQGFNDQITSVQYSSDQQQPLVSHQKSANQSSKKKSRGQKDYKTAFHPIIFEYGPVSQCVPKQSYIEKTKDFKITYHESLVTFAKTKPTGKLNKSIKMGLNGNKIADRFYPQVMEKTQTKLMSGYYVKNETRNMIRIQTEDGCTFCRGLQSVWVWSQEILKVWQCEKCMQLPKWSLYSEKQIKK